MDGSPVFAIEPLSAKNRLAMVEHMNVEDTNEFLRWVRRNRFEEFAAWPRSLEWLAEQFRIGRRESITYTQLCQLRVARSFAEDKRLTDARLAGKAQAWAHAIMLVAATLVFCGKKGILLDRYETDCLTLDDLFCTGDRLEIPGQPPLTREDLREALRTSHLIEPHGSYYRFENQSDLEFLAGAMLASFDVEQLGELLGSPAQDGRWRVFPQLATTSSNLAAQSPHFFDYLLAHDPRVLMRADFASKSADARRAAIDAMLTATAKTGATGEHDQHSHFSTLRHAEITAQLPPWIFDEKNSPVVRELAFDIARECCGGELWLEFERTAAAGDEFAARRLPLVIRLFGTNWPDERLRAWAGSADDELAGAALGALLDRGTKLRDIVYLLHSPRSDAIGSYSLHFGRLSRECTSDDVPVALPVIGQWPSIAANHSPVRDLAFALVSKGVAALDRPNIRTAVTKFLISRFEDNRKYNAGASSVVRRTAARLRAQAPPRVKTNVAVACIPAGRQSLYFFPDRLLVYDSDGVGAVAYGDLEMSSGPTKFIEEEGVPKDAEVVGRTWLYVNKSGGPDRRFSGNRELPVVRYDELDLVSQRGLNEKFQFSSTSASAPFVAAVRRLSDALGLAASAATHAEAAQSGRTFAGGVNEWFFYFTDAVQGPVSLGTLAQLESAGSISPETLICTERDRTWRRYGDAIPSS
jgi:hypothetical protein